MQKLIATSLPKWLTSQRDNGGRIMAHWSLWLTKERHFYRYRFWCFFVLLYMGKKLISPLYVCNGKNGVSKLTKWMRRMKGRKKRTRECKRNSAKQKQMRELNMCHWGWRDNDVWQRKLMRQRQWQSWTETTEKMCWDRKERRVKENNSWKPKEAERHSER